ncbi:MAG: hypothetical protein HMLKMBBP_01168 [Planctomycetes bacterium]|nr:hypothetical protein [Planctomycetota bacterium]
MARTHRSVARHGFLALTVGAAAAFGGGAGSAAGAEGEVNVYSFDVVTAPVCLEGTFPFTLTTDDGASQGTLTVETDAKGRVTGTADYLGLSFQVTGSVKFKAAKSTLSLDGTSGRTKLALDGVLGGGPGARTFAGGASVKGDAALARKGTCVIDLASAPEQTATVDVVLTEGKKGKFAAEGTAASCGDVVALKGGGKASKLSFKGKSFTLSLRQGDGGFEWESSGFGASASGSGLVLDPLDVPTEPVYSVPVVEYEEGDAIAANVIVGGTNPRGRFSVSPGLPAGLAIDVVTGAITGTPTEISPLATYTVTASNAAGSAAGTLRIQTRLNRSRSFAFEGRTLAEDDYRHFLTRTRWFATDADMAAVQSQGVDTYLNTMLSFQRNTAAEQAAAATELVNVTDPPGLEGKFPSSTQVARWWTNLMLNSENPFKETIGFFWHDHFGCSTVVLEGSNNFYMVDHVNKLRYGGNGNFRQLLLDVARDPMMLVFLDGRVNTRTAPNENFAREFWELYTLGVDNVYTQADIVQGAKAWSGYRERYDANGLGYMSVDTNRHDTGAKTIFGQTIPGNQTTDQDYESVVDVTLGLPGRPVAKFITKKLFEYYAFEDPDQVLVDEMADYFVDTCQWELAPFLRRLFTCEAFFHAKARRAQVKAPVEYGVGFIRATGLVLRVSSLDSLLNTLGQRPTQSPTVNGWPLGELWLSSQGLADRTNLIYQCVEDTTRQRNAGIDVVNLMPPSGQRTAGNTVDTLAERLRVELTEADRTELVEYLNTVRNTNGTTTNSPFDGESQSHRDERVRGLLLILAQHPTYQVR